MTYTYTNPLSDEALIRHLEAGDCLVFIGAAIRWQEIERQVDHLGYGDGFMVTATKGKHGKRCRVTPHRPSH